MKTKKSLKMETSKLKLGQQVEITYKEAKELMAKTEGEYDFDCLNESTISDTVDFETVQNRKYYVTKTGRKGSKIYAGSEYETKAEEGIFEVEMTWDFRHPTNFAQNENNLSRKFKVVK